VNPTYCWVWQPASNNSTAWARRLCRRNGRRRRRWLTYAALMSNANLPRIVYMSEVRCRGAWVGTDIKRCGWAGDDLLMQTYHDLEWGVPQHDSRMLWEMLMLEGFQAGLAWITVLRKRDAFRKAFAGFRPAKVAHFGNAEIARLMNNAGIIRGRAKIEATIRGAQIYCEMAENGETFDQFCWSFTDGRVLENSGRRRVTSSPLSERISKELKRRGFKFVGPTIVYAWMQGVGIVNDHSQDCFRRSQVMKSAAS